MSKENENLNEDAVEAVNGSEAEAPQKKTFTQRYKELWKFIKFAFTGASTSILELAVYYFCFYVVFKSMTHIPVTNSFLLWLGMDYLGVVYTNVVANIVGYAAAFIMNRKMTFKSDSNVALSIFLYILMVAFTIVANTWTGSLMASWAINSGHDNALVHGIISLISMTIPTIWTYPLSRFVIFRQKNPKDGEQAEAAENK